MEPQVITVRSIVDANLLAIKEARLQAFLDPKDFGNVGPNGGWVKCKNIIGNLPDKRGCAMGVTYSQDLRERLTKQSFSTSEGRGIEGAMISAIDLSLNGMISFPNKVVAQVANLTQRLHDCIASRHPYPFRFVDYEKVGIEEIDTFTTKYSPTTEDFKRWLGILDKYADEIDTKAA